MLATGAAFAQGTGQGTGSGDGKGTGDGNEQTNAAPRSGQPAGAPGITTQSTSPAVDRPTEAQCRAGWDSSMRWSRGEFDAFCR